MTHTSQHFFHIPVMGLGFTIDTPIKVAKYGISSVISIMEDHLIERMRETISKKENIEYEYIPEDDMDYRAKRITSYLNVLNRIVKSQVQKIKSESFNDGYDLNHYFKLLPDTSRDKKIYNTLHLYSKEDKEVIYKQLKDNMIVGSIDVNIMTKLDKTNYDRNGDELPQEFSDALSALRGYANSDLDSSIVFSAGMNPRLFSYCEQFSDFYPDAKGYIKKKIILKVSDYRSALIQGKYLAKKGLWVSEYRIESGINCGGHAFVSNGILFGPILEEFKNKRKELFQEVFNDCNKALDSQNKTLLSKTSQIKITAQGGIGNYTENKFLLEYYNVDSIGWGSPFLLVPEATNVDAETLNKLSCAKKEDYYLSHSSPLGVPFNNFRLSSSEDQRKMRISKKKPGSPCYKKFLSNNTEFTERVICTASRQYQKLKIEQIKQTHSNPETLEKAIEMVTEKDCLCEGLGASALIVNKAKLSHNLSAVTICPGPNLAFFSGIFSFEEMVNHIYGRTNLLNDVFRPNCFINELELYLKYIKDEIDKFLIGLSSRNISYFQSFKNNLNIGIEYYESICEKVKSTETLFPDSNIKILQSIKGSINQLFSGLDEIKPLSISNQ
jgi:hypothetical protein